MKNYFENKNNEGFTILELLIAMSVLSFALIALASLATQTLKSSEYGKRLSQSVNIATTKMEILKAIPFANLQSTNGGNLAVDGNLARTCSPTVQSGAGFFICIPDDNTEEPGNDGMIFSWTWTITYIDMDGDGDIYQDSGTASDLSIDSDDIKRIDLKVVWTDIYGGHTTTLKTLRARI